VGTPQDALIRRPTGPRRVTSARAACAYWARRLPIYCSSMA